MSVPKGVNIWMVVSLEASVMVFTGKRILFVHRK